MASRPMVSSNGCLSAPRIYFLSAVKRYDQLKQWEYENSLKSRLGLKRHSLTKVRFDGFAPSKRIAHR